MPGEGDVDAVPRGDVPERLHRAAAAVLAAGGEARVVEDDHGAGRRVGGQLLLEPGSLGGTADRAAVAVEEVQLPAVERATVVPGGRGCAVLEVAEVAARTRRAVLVVARHRPRDPLQLAPGLRVGVDEPVVAAVLVLLVTEDDHPARGQRRGGAVRRPLPTRR